MSEIPPGPSPELPDVDERLVAPGSRFEIIDGKVVYVAPADEPHGTSHARLAAVVEAHKHDDFSVAVDMLTRTSRIDDIAPDVSVFPTARDPKTGRRQLEQLAFEIASTESLGHAADKARRLVGRGVRRVFAIDLERERVLEWSRSLDGWSILDLSSQIVDDALAVALPVAPLLDAARTDDAITRAFRMRRHPEFLAEREEGRIEGEIKGRAEGEIKGRAQGRAEGEVEGRARGPAELLLAMLAARGLVATAAEVERIMAERDLARLVRWATAVPAVSEVAALIAIP